METRRVVGEFRRLESSARACPFRLRKWEVHHPWWVIELFANIVLVALAVGLGPFIKRFGRSYAADVFRANPRTGKSYLVLTDVAYYLIFTSFVLFAVTFVEQPKWERSTGTQLEHEISRIGGILLICVRRRWTSISVICART